MNIGIHGINLDDRKKNVLSDLVKVIKKYKINIFYSKRLSKQLSFKNIKT